MMRWKAIVKFCLLSVGVLTGLGFLLYVSRPPPAFDPNDDPYASEPAAGTTLHAGAILRLRALLPANHCVDMLDGIRPGVYACHGGETQQIRTGPHGQLLLDGRCLTGDPAEFIVTFGDCLALGSPYHARQRWAWRIGRDDSSRGQVVHATNMCLSSAASGRLRLGNCTTACADLWMLDYGTATSDLPAARQLLPAHSPPPHNGPRVLCWILSNPATQAIKGVAVAQTWGRKCSRLLFASAAATVPGLDYLLLKLDGPESRNLLWDKAQLVWMHLYREELESYEWFIKADDDSYIIFDHLLAFLRGYNPKEPHYLGRRYWLGGDPNMIFVAGGTGEILSQGALCRLGQAVDTHLPHTIFNPVRTFENDVQIAVSLKKIGIQAADTRDKEGKHRFIPYGLEAEHTMYRTGPDVNPDWWAYSPDAKEGLDCCSTRWVSAHYLQPEEIYMLDKLEQGVCVPDLERWPYLQLGREEVDL